MPDVEVTVTDRLETELDRIVETGDFINREQAIEEILMAGLSAYSRSESTDDRAEEPLIQTASEQVDPARTDAPGEDYTF